MQGKNRRLGGAAAHRGCYNSARLAAPVAAPEFMPDSTDEFVIVAATAEGKAFRPGDRAERSCGALAESGGDERLETSPQVHPTSIDAVSAVVVGAGQPRKSARTAGKRTGAMKHAAQGGR